jgi:glycosyltransferase involved in cell wall biosynthesis
MQVIIGIPAYNEERTLPHVIKEIKEAMSKTKYKYKIVVVNDGSKDKTIEVAKQNGAIVFSNARNLGLAETFKNEIKIFLESKADVFVHTDADGQYFAEDIPKLLKEIENGSDLVIGSRFQYNNGNLPWSKVAGNKAFARALSKLLKIKLTDTTSGFRAFTREVAQNIKFINTFTYTQEQIIRAAKQNFRIKEIPIMTRKTRESRLFKNPLEYAIKAWINILRIYRDYDPLKFFGKIGMALISLGLISGLFILYTFITTGKVGHVPLTILTMLLILSGIQVIIFGFLADMNKK